VPEYGCEVVAVIVPEIGTGTPDALPWIVVREVPEVPAVVTLGKPVPAFAVTVPLTACVAGKLLTLTPAGMDDTHGEVLWVTAIVLGKVTLVATGIPPVTPWMPMILPVALVPAAVAAPTVAPPNWVTFTFWGFGKLVTVTLLPPPPPEEAIKIGPDPQPR
jgi:hypothetical protein